MVRGRKPKATAVKEASGALKKNPQRRNTREPKPVLGAPPMPPTVRVDKIAKEQWTELCNLLAGMNILTTADSGVMAMYCTTYSEWIKAYEHVREHGVSCLTAAGSMTTSPEASNWHKLSDRIIRLFAELGLTPSSRSRIKAPELSETENPFTDLLERFSGLN